MSAISTAEDINDTIHVIVDYRVGICPFNISVLLQTRCCSMVRRRSVFNLHNALNDRSEDHDVAGITARICTTLEISNRTVPFILDSICNSK